MKFSQLFNTLADKIPHYFRVITFWDVFEIVLVAVVIYHLLKFIHDTSVERVLKGIIILLVLMPISEFLNLSVINFVLRNTLQIGMLAIIIMFQPELRRMLENLGGSNIQQIFERDTGVGETRKMIHEVVEACSSMSWSHTGALIVFERKNPLSDVVTAATEVDAKVTSQLVGNIFFKNSPLHDGAMVIRNARVAVAGGVLPVSENEKISKELGTRHRAGIGISEVSDCISVMVSEETGSISVAMKGRIRRGLSPENLEKTLTAELIEEAGENEGQMHRVRRNLHEAIKPKSDSTDGKGDV